MQALAVCQFDKFSLETICFHHRFTMRNSFSAAGCGLLPSDVTLPQRNESERHHQNTHVSEFHQCAHKHCEM